MSKIGELADEFYPLGWLRYQYKRIVEYPKYIKQKKEIIERCNGKVDFKYQKIKELKEMYKGKRCFIVATGPSLTIEDVELLKNEITFGVNSICKLCNLTTWKPTYLGIQDPLVYAKLEDIILQDNNQIVLAGSSLLKDFDLPDRFVLFPSIWNHKQYMNSYMHYGTKFSDNAYAAVYDGYSITYSMIQIAVYMGFREIYLLGTDCSYIKGEKNHFIESGHYDRREHLNYNRMVAGYQVAKEYAKSNGVKIINCTRGGMLEVFPRMKLEEVLED